MIYRNLASCLDDLERNQHLVRIDTEVDPYLEAGAIQRRVFQAGGPALLFTRVKGSSFPMAANIFGTRQRTHFIFRSTLKRVEALLAAKADPAALLKRPGLWPDMIAAAWHTRPKVVRDGPVLAQRTRISSLPQLVSWPKDGGAYVTLPLVYTESPARPGFLGSNLGMYRVQLSGSSYEPDKEVGLHYQIHRGIGYHHAEAIARHQALRVNVFVGGPPAMTLAAIMPLPEGVAEVLFAGALGGHRIPMICRPGRLPVLAEADFCICGHIVPGVEKPEGPFGDHLGYYSLTHDFPVMAVDEVLHRNGAVWPFTTVGRPPQEDTMFGDFIHELTAELIPQVFGACTKSMPWTRQVCIRCFWPWAVNAMSRMLKIVSPRNLLPMVWPCWARLRPRCPNMFCLRPVKMSHPCPARTCRVFFSMCLSAWICPVICILSPVPPWIPWIIQVSA